MTDFSLPSSIDYFERKRPENNGVERITDVDEDAKTE